MHELGIVFHIIRTVEGVCAQNGVSRVSAVTLSLGEVSGVVPHYLTDAWKWASNKNPLVAGSELKVEEIPAITYCEACGKTYGTVEHGRTCPYCASGQTYLLQGQEVMVKEIETPDEELLRDDAGREYVDGATPLSRDAADAASEASPDPVDAANPMIIE